MASYSLVSSYSTVQVLSPTLVNEVVYCTIRTSPSSVLASKPVDETVFHSGGAGTDLLNFANAIEDLMSQTPVIAATGQQQIDASGLLQDFVTFTVQYVPKGSSGTSVTAEADVPVAILDFSDATLGHIVFEEAVGIINGVAADLKKAAGA